MLYKLARVYGGFPALSALTTATDGTPAVGLLRKLDPTMLRTSILLFVTCIPISVFAENWPQWRGPDASGRAAPGEYPIKFSPMENLRWQVRLPGRGSSTPAVWDESIFVTCPIDGQDGVFCYDMNGTELWRRKLGPQRAGKHANGSGSNPSPVTDGEVVIVYFKSGTLAGLDLAGKVLWKTNLQERYGADTLWWDLGTSPVLAGDKVVVAVMQGGDSYLVAFEKGSGDVAWKQERIFECEEESDHAYTTPTIHSTAGRDVIVTWGADHLTGHDLETGNLLWQCGGFNPDQSRAWRVIASAALDEQIAVVPYGRGDFLAAVSLGQAAGDITETHRLWEKQGKGIGCDVPTPILHGEQLILLRDRGIISCLDKSSGDLLWEESLPRARGKFFASPILAGNTLYCTRVDGTMFVGKLTDEGFELLAENSLGEKVIATPVPIRQSLLVRGAEHLFMFGQ